MQQANNPSARPMPEVATHSNPGLTNFRIIFFSLFNLFINYVHLSGFGQALIRDLIIKILW